MNKKLTIGVIVAVSFMLFFLSLTVVSCINEENATDYSKSEHWLSLPASIDKKVDVFYIYPTVWQKVDKDEPNICDIDHPSMLNGSKTAFDGQATAFETTGNIYAPYYRQSDAASILSFPSIEERERERYIYIYIYISLLGEYQNLMYLQHLIIILNTTIMGVRLS